MLLKSTSGVIHTDSNPQINGEHWCLLILPEPYRCLLLLCYKTLIQCNVVTNYLLCLIYCQLFHSVVQSYGIMSFSSISVIMTTAVMSYEWLKVAAADNDHLRRVSQVWRIGSYPSTHASPWISRPTAQRQIGRVYNAAATNLESQW